MQWLPGQGLKQMMQDGTKRLSAYAFNELKQSELPHTAKNITSKSGLSYAILLKRSTSPAPINTPSLASGKYPFIKNVKELVLVPWKPSLENMSGKVVSGVAGSNRSWDLIVVRQRGIEI
jgi:hypothetical protein